MSSYKDKQAAAAVDDAPSEDQAGNAPHNGPQVRRFSWLYFICFVGAFGLAKRAGHTFECVGSSWLWQSDPWLPLCTFPVCACICDAQAVPTTGIGLSSAGRHFKIALGEPCLSCLTPVSGNRPSVIILAVR